ncbi:MAG: hypothetical protein NTY67_02505 [Cyanobacteria bacterium]|nr:hypothetical protein [Cyanobacteriota bacterium]
MGETSMLSDRQREAARMLRIAHRDLKAARSMLDPDLFDEASWAQYPRTHDLALLDQLIIDCGGDPTRFLSLENFTPFGSRLRYDEEAEPENLDRVLLNQLCADLLEHVASLSR